MKPTPTLRFFFSETSRDFISRRAAGESAANDFSMKTFTPLIDGIFEVDGAKGRVGGEENDVAGIEAVDGLLVGVETENGDRRARRPCPECGDQLAWLPLRRSSKTSAIACSLTGPPPAAKASATAPLPRPPQPM